MNNLSGSLKKDIVIASRYKITAWQSPNYGKRQCKNNFRQPETFTKLNLKQKKASVIGWAFQPTVTAEYNITAEYI
ncbi:MAG: hypothetical protein J5680_03085 [Neisseriaceae bacterium]|nr:hypothetical protein [Neisseriaceae bacterium]